MNKKIEYIVRYETDIRIVTIYCVDRFNMQDLVETLEEHNIPYVVVKINNMNSRRLKWLCDFGDIFKED